MNRNDAAKIVLLMPNLENMHVQIHQNYRDPVNLEYLQDYVKEGQVRNLKSCTLSDYMGQDDFISSPSLETVSIDGSLDNPDYIKSFFNRHANIKSVRFDGIVPWFWESPIKFDHLKLSEFRLLTNRNLPNEFFDVFFASQKFLTYFEYLGCMLVRAPVIRYLIAQPYLKKVGLFMTHRERNELEAITEDHLRGLASKETLRSIRIFTTGQEHFEWFVRGHNEYLEEWGLDGGQYEFSDESIHLFAKNYPNLKRIVSRCVLSMKAFLMLSCLLKKLQTVTAHFDLSSMRPPFVYDIPENFSMVSKVTELKMKHLRFETLPFFPSVFPNVRYLELHQKENQEAAAQMAFDSFKKMISFESNGKFLANPGVAEIVISHKDQLQSIVAYAAPDEDFDKVVEQLKGIYTEHFPVVQILKEYVSFEKL